MKRMLLSTVIVVLLIALVINLLHLSKKRETLAQSSAFSQESLYITPEGQVTDAIVKLLGLTGVRITDDRLQPEKDWVEAKLWLKSRALKEVVPAVQGKIDATINWLGDVTKERWEEDQSKPKLVLDQAIQIINTCSATLKQSEQILPLEDVRGVLFLGATLSRVRTRIAYLNHLYETKQISADLPVYVLTGERKLDDKVGETQASLMDSDNGIIKFRKDWKKSDGTINDEGQMIQLVFDQSRHSSLNMDKVFLVYSSKGQGRRATTESTIYEWLKVYNPQAGQYVAISNQPYVFYQESVIRRALFKVGRPDIQVRVVGPSMPSEIGDETAVIDRAKNLLNNLSRILYELNQIQELEKKS